MTELDATGLRCPLPVLRAKKRLKDVAPGGTLRILATDPDAVADFEAFCAARPELAPRLRRLHANLSGLSLTPDDVGASLEGTDLAHLEELVLPEEGRYEVHGEVARGGMGAILEIRDRETRTVLHRASNPVAGDAVIFRLSPELQHRVTPVTGETPRTAFAGWYQTAPDIQDVLRELRVSAREMPSE